jgi:hypothetical protein
VQTWMKTRVTTDATNLWVLHGYLVFRIGDTALKSLPRMLSQTLCVDSTTAQSVTLTTFLYDLKLRESTFVLRTMIGREFWLQKR